jgi:hypothetical protein
MSLTVKAMEIDQRKKYQILTYFAIIISIVTAGAFLYQSTNPYAVTDTFHVRVGKMTNFDFPVSERQAREGSSIEFQASGTNFGIQVLEPLESLYSKDNLDNYETTLVTDKAGLYHIIISNTGPGEDEVSGTWKRSPSDLGTKSQDIFNVPAGDIMSTGFMVDESQARQGSQIEFQASGTNFGIQVLEPRQTLDTKENINHYETTLVTDKAGFYRFTVFSTDLREGYVRGIWRSLSIPELGVGTGGMILVILLLVSLFSLLVSIYSFYQAKKLKNAGLSENT